MTDKLVLVPAELGKQQLCKRCSGGGEVPSSTVPWGDRFPGMWSSCPDCKGTGRTALSQVRNG